MVILVWLGFFVCLVLLFVFCFGFFSNARYFREKKVFFLKKIIASSFVIGEAQSSITVFELSSC